MVKRLFPAKKPGAGAFKGLGGFRGLFEDLYHGDGRVRYASAAALSKKLRGSSVRRRGTVLSHLNRIASASSEDYELRGKAVSLAGLFGGKKSLEFLRRRLLAPGGGLKEEAVEGLLLHNDKRGALRVLASALNHPHGMTQLVAFAGIQSLARRSVGGKRAVSRDEIARTLKPFVGDSRTVKPVKLGLREFLASKKA